jgi:hypothetical protein
MQPKRAPTPDAPGTLPGRVPWNGQSAAAGADAP